MKALIGRYFTTPTLLYVIGIMSMACGLNGKENAISFARPNNDSLGWTTPNELINLFTYVPLTISIFFLILSTVTFTISYYHWINHKDTEAPYSAKEADFKNEVRN